MSCEWVPARSLPKVLPPSEAPTSISSPYEPWVRNFLLKPQDQVRDWIGAHKALSASSPMRTLLLKAVLQDEEEEEEEEEGDSDASPSVADVETEPEAEKPSKKRKANKTETKPTKKKPKKRGGGGGGGGRGEELIAHAYGVKFAEQKVHSLMIRC